MSFSEDFDQLSSYDKGQFSKTVDNLLFHCFIVRKKYDKATGTDKICYDYTYIERHFSLIDDYLSYIGITLVKDEDAGVIYIRNEDEKNRVRVDTATTFVVYALRVYYEEQVKNNPNSLEIKMDSNQLRQLLADLGLSTINKRLTLSTISSAMKLLANFNVLIKKEGSFNDNFYSFYILPPIRYVISNTKLNALYKFLTGNTSEQEGEEGEDEKEEVTSEGTSSGEQGPQGF